MAALGSQSIASSYEQLLHVDSDGGGNSTTHVSVKDGDNGTTFGFTIASDALMMSSTNRLEFGDTGTYIHQSADGVLDLVSDTEIEINATTIDMNGALDLSGNAQLSGTVTVGADGSGTDVIFYSGTAGDNFTWDASDEKLIITGTDGQTALDVADGNVSITDDLAVDGTSNLDNTDIDGTFAVDGTTISLDATTSLNIDNSNTSNGITVGTATSGVPISIGHTTSETTVNDNLVVTGDIDLAGSIDVDGTANLDNTDIDGTLTQDAGAVVFNEAGADYDFRVESDDNVNMLFVDGGNDRVGIGTALPEGKFHVDAGDAGSVTASGNADEMIVETNTDGGISILSPDASWGALSFGSPGADVNTLIASNYNSGSQILRFYVGGEASGNMKMLISAAGLVGINESANAQMTQGLTINQGAADDDILAFKSSDVAHGMTDNHETDTYAAFNKVGATEGGFRVSGYSEGTTGVLLDGIGTTANTTKSASGAAYTQIRSWKKSSNGWNTVGADENILTVGNGNSTKFIVDEDGDLFADGGTTTDAVTVYDEYDDAQLVRSLDISYGPESGLIDNKFDEFIDYNHEKLAELNLVGREEDGSPNHFINVTGMQRLHNGAIWQQYTEMQKMKELMYDTMVEMLGKEKADQKLTDHDIKLLDNKTLLN
jgi:hypothetical protein